MKTLNIYKNTTLALMALTMGLSLVGCAEDSELVYQGAQQLSVKPLILDNKVSRATTLLTQTSTKINSIISTSRCLVNIMSAR